MAWSITNQGGNTNKSGADISLSLAADVGVGTLIVIGVSDRSAAASGGSLVDSRGINSYTAIVSAAHGGLSVAGFGALWYTVTESTLSSTATITYTKVTSGVSAAISALSATGGSFNPLDILVTASQTSSTDVCSVTSGSPAVPGELFVGFSSIRDGIDVITDPTWTSPPLTTQKSGSTITDASQTGAYQINAGTGSLTYSTSATGTSGMANFIVGFQVSVAEFTLYEQLSRPKIAAKTMVAY